MENTNNLLFRRQFIMGTEKANKFPEWEEKMVGKEFFLYCHPDLEVNYFKKGEKELFLLGFILDPYNPQLSNKSICEEIILNSARFEDVLSYIDKYSGRWILIWKDKLGIKMMNDACGARQIYFYSDGNRAWCGSQPSIIAYELGLKMDDDPELINFINSNEYKKNKYEWYGNGTVYKNLLHMLPNHYLNLNSLEIKRFWPYAELDNKEIADSVKEASQILRGTLESIVYRFNKVMLSVTAGNDSRIVLAASKTVKDKIKYFFCMDDSNSKSKDYKVSSKLLPRLGIKQDIVRTNSNDDKFMDIYKQNVTSASDMPSKKNIYTFYKEFSNYIHVSGVCGEIARNYYYINYNRGVSAQELISVSKYKDIKYMEKSISMWLDDAKKVSNLHTINTYDLYYWENLCGNWGAKSAAEQDIAIEEVWPYNNRKLMTSMLSVKESYRKPPFFRLQRRIIKSLWKETMSKPINPNIIKKTLWILRNCISRINQTLQKMKFKEAIKSPVS